MPAVDKLLLEEALQDSPQTRSLLSVFEEDAGTLTDHTNQLLQAMQRVYGAQNEMCLATQQLSRQLLAYEKQNFALGKGDEEVISTLHYFSKVVDELNVLHTELAKQLADTMVLPIIQFREKDLTEVSTLKDLFGLASNGRHCPPFLRPGLAHGGGDMGCVPSPLAPRPSRCSALCFQSTTSRWPSTAGCPRGRRMRR